MENYLSTITNYLLTQSWQIAALVAVIAAINLALKNRSAHVRYLLWLIVLAKCLVPPLLTVPLAVLPEERPAVVVTMLDRSVAEPPVRPVTPVVVAQAPTIVERPARFNSRQWLVFGWVMGVAAFVIFAVIKALRTNFWLWRQRKQLPAEPQTEIEDLFSGLGIKTLPKVWLVDGIGQPFVWGLLRGSIYLPADFVKVNSAEHRRSVLGHELSHILRFDAAVNILQIIAQAVFWFHPFVWWANKKIRAEREKCCDEMAIDRLGAKTKDYSIAIVNTLVAEHESTRPVPSLAVAGPVKNIEERIKTMMKPGKKFYKRPSLIAAIAVMLIALLTVPTALVLTARAAEEVETKSEARPTKSLHQAAANGDLDQVKSHISNGADVNAKDQRGRAPLHRAAYPGHTEVVRLLVEHGADVNVEDKLKRTPLEHAAVASRTQVVKLLIEKGANLNARNEGGATPLHVAAGSADKDTVEVLIDKGASVTLRDTGGSTPLYWAMMSSNPNRREIVEIIVATGKVPSTIHLAAYMGDSAKVKTFIEEAVAVNEKGAGAVTALHCAAAGGQKEVAELLLAHGADVNARATDGMTPLQSAVYCSDDEETIKLLIANGADVNATANVEGETGMSVLGLRFARCVMQSLELADGGDKGDDLMTARVKLLWDSEITKLLMSKGARLGDGDNMWLSIAAAMEIPDIIELAIAQSGDVNQKQPDGSTLLHHAARLGQRKLVEQLLAKGADINASDYRGRTPLAVAKQQKHTEVVNILRQHGAVETLHGAVTSGNIDEVKRLLSEGHDVNSRDSEGQTPLHLAANLGNAEIVEILISNGADIEARDGRWHNTALLNAAVRGRKEVVQLLLEKGANIEAKDGNGLTPLKLTAAYGTAIHTAVIQLLLDKGANIESRSYGDSTPLQSAIGVGRKDVAELLLAHGAKLNVMSKFYGTPAHHAMRQRRPDMVRWSIAKGIAIPPLHLAAYFGEIGKVRSLLSEGADVNQKDIESFTPLHCAMLGQNTKIAQLLIDNGADIEARNCANQTPLYYACERGYLEMVKLLIANRADLNTRGYRRGELGYRFVDDWSPLHIAAHMGHTDVVEYLLSKGANIHVKCKRFNDESFTPLHLAAWNGHVDVVKKLLAKGADANLKTKKGRTALDFAREKNHTDVVELLRKHGAKE